MTNLKPGEKPPRSPIRRWIRRGFILWAVVSTAWLANSFRTSGVDPKSFKNGPLAAVRDEPATLQFHPSSPKKTGLIFLCGSGVAAHAYAPLLRPIADAGYPVFVVKLPYRFAPLESHKLEAIDRVHAVIANNPHISQWILSGHSLGGALACRVINGGIQKSISGMVLVGTTHPKQDNLSGLELPVTKVYATSDGVAPAEKVIANKHLLPEHTKWVEIKGGNHSQFGHYGHQLLDRIPTIDRQNQQKITRSALLEALAEAEDS